MISTITQLIKYVKWGKKLTILFPVFSNLIMVAYLIVAMIFGMGNLIVNGILIGITILIILVTIVLKDKKSKKEVKKKKVIKISTVRKTIHFLNIIKIIVKTYTLGITLYGLYMAVAIVSPIAIISAIMSIILWIFSVVSEFITILLDSLKDGFEKDKELFANLYEKSKEYAQEKISQGKEFAQEKYNQGKEFVEEKYAQGKEYALATVEQGKTKLDEAKTAVQGFFKKDKKAE